MDNVYIMLILFFLSVFFSIVQHIVTIIIIIIVALSGGIAEIAGMATAIYGIIWEFVETFYTTIIMVFLGTGSALSKLVKCLSTIGLAFVDTLLQILIMVPYLNIPVEILSVVVDLIQTSIFASGIF
jgi:hypothetical protein